MIIHFCLREDDGDLLYWRKSLPRGTFNYYVRQALLAEKAKRIADLPLPEKLGNAMDLWIQNFISMIES